MVMEPTLLILDEPTSGLDSSSSQLLLRAHHREALEGVTICLVVHKPRLGKQCLREARSLGVDYMILCLAGVCLGTLAKVNDEKFWVDSYIYTIIAVSLLCRISILRSFSLDKLHYWRERASGMSSLAYFLAKDKVDHFNTVIKLIVYLSMFYFFNNPRLIVADNYVILLALDWYRLHFCHLLPTGISTIVGRPSSGCLNACSNKEKQPKITLKHMLPRWALEAFVIVNAKRSAVLSFP
ncbi:putative P-loop containing nucleoside triphosphate hydrolase, ABC transporter family G [Dioscorea sansibarensis]